MSKNNNNTYQTRDLYFASYLQAKKLTLVDVEKTFDNGGSFCVFVFSPNHACKEAEISFYQNEAYVDAKQYADSIKYLKQLVHRN